ncbi:hypothetical protein ACJMK2_036226 [Sinanodonta woodiana]|uniref:Apoptogenic protein 1, mitochondrial n=1 Tax=Sinanodonta woodiana TaxID=1069815 RepID=A0ABD3WK18_SINWO
MAVRVTSQRCSASFITLRRYNGQLAGKDIAQTACEKSAVSKPSTEARQNNRKYDWIGPPDPVSNIRQVHFKVSENEAPHEKRLREERAKVQEWSHRFWKKHNTSFVQLKGEFIKQKLAEKSASRETTVTNITLTPDEMSEFYKKFLDDNYQAHKNYNWEWYKKNISLTWLTLKVNLLNIITRRNKGNK